MITRSKGQTGAGAPECSETESAKLVRRLAGALGNLGDRAALNANPLARLTYVEERASDKYHGRIMPRGLALRAIILECLERIWTDLEDERQMARPCEYLRLRSAGLTCRRISEQLGLSREHVSRTIRMEALQLLAEEFLDVLRKDGKSRSQSRVQDLQRQTTAKSPHD